MKNILKTDFFGHFALNFDQKVISLQIPELIIIQILTSTFVGSFFIILLNTTVCSSPNDVFFLQLANQYDVPFFETSAYAFVNIDEVGVRLKNC